MSIEAITWALRQPVPSSSAKFVLVVVANCASGATGLAYPSIAYLSEATGQDRKTIIANLRRLSEWGLISDTGERTGATKQVPVYRVECKPDLLSEQSQKRNSSRNGTVPKTDGNSTVFPLKQSQKRDTEPLITIRNQEQKIAPKGDNLLSDVDPQVAADFKSLRSKLRAPITPTAVAGIQREAAKAGMSFEAALVMCCERGWRGFRADWVSDSAQSRAGPQPQQPVGKQMQGVMALEELKNAARDRQRNRLATGGTGDGPAEARLLVAGSNARR